MKSFARLIGLSFILIQLLFSQLALAGSPQTFYAHSENRGYEANDNMMDQAVGEPNAATYSRTPTATGSIQLYGNNTTTGGRYFTEGWPSAQTISSGTWTFKTWLQMDGGTATYEVRVFKNADAGAQFTSSTAAIPSSWTEVSTTGSAPAIDMAATDRLRFEYWANVTALPTAQAVPTGDGDVTGTWNIVPSSPTTRYDKVDDPIGSPDDNTTYVYASAVGRRLFTYPAFSVPSNATITNLTITYRHRDNGSTGNNNIRSSLKVNGSYYITDPGINANNSLTVWADRSYAWTTNPGTGAAWTPDEINGVTSATELQQWGVYSSDVSPNPAVTQVYATVNYRVPISIRVDDLSATDTGTRVDTTVNQTIDALGYFVLTGAILVLLYVLKRKNVLVLRKGEAL